MVALASEAAGQSFSRCCSPLAEPSDPWQLARPASWSLPAQRWRDINPAFSIMLSQAPSISDELFDPQHEWVKPESPACGQPARV
jgi:hypothetical protein